MLIPQRLNPIVIIALMVFLLVLMLLSFAIPALTPLPWWPDLFTPHYIPIASIQSKSGHKFVLYQFLGSDFYSTRLLYCIPDGHAEVFFVDGDGSRLWGFSTQMLIDETVEQVEFQNGFPPVFGTWTTKYNWHTGHIRRNWVRSDEDEQVTPFEQESIERMANCH
jgi:hypothetical protein